MAPQFKGVGLVLSLLLSTALAFEQAPQNQPRLRSNSTLDVTKLSSINARDLFGLESRDYYECPVGYAECSDDTSTCCALGKTCCSTTDYCASPGGVCCNIGTCPAGWNCCGNDGYCSPVGGECCDGGYYCNVGYQCKVYDGEDICCPDTGCVGSDGTGDYGTTYAAGGSATGSATRTDTYMTTSTSSYTYSYTYDEYSYYYTTYHWTFWYYFWTSYSPYTVSTVTSTKTTSTNVWSVYASDSAMASRSFEYSAEVFTQSIPYSATYLESSTDAVPLNTGGGDLPTATALSGDIPHKDAATSVSVNRWVPWACALFGGLMGVLAFGL